MKRRSQFAFTYRPDWIGAVRLAAVRG